MPDPAQHDPVVEVRERPGFVLSLTTSLLMCLIGIRCFVASTFDPAFDVDPLVDPQRWFGIGPGEASLISVLSLMLSSIILFEARVSGRGIDRLLLLLASIPLIPILLHGTLSAGDMARGLDWFSRGDRSGGDRSCRSRTRPSGTCSPNAPRDPRDDLRTRSGADLPRASDDREVFRDELR